MPTSTTLTYAARFDSNSANNPAMNLTGAPSTLITFAPQTISGGQGDLLLEGGGAGPDPDTVVLINGTPYQFTFSVSGTLPTLKKFGANKVPEQFQGDPVYIITVHNYPSSGQSTRLAFLPGQEVDPNDPVATQAARNAMNAFGTGAVNINGNFAPPNTPVCFCAGTMIRTPKGELAVERMKIGDEILTDRGPQRILWISFSAHEWGAEPHVAKPFVVPKDAFGAGLPVRDLELSPQHKLALRDARTGALLLAPVVGLAGFRGIRQRNGCRAARYYHVLLPRHAVIEANGLPAESFYPGATAIRMLSPENRTTLASKLLGLGALANRPGSYAPAATMLTRRQTVQARAGLEVFASRPASPAAAVAAA